MISGGCGAARVARPLLVAQGVDTASVMRAAIELYRERHYSSVVAVVGDALDQDPDSIHLRMLRARAWLALRRDLEAQQDLSDVIRTEPRCATAYRLLGELAVRRDELASARIFLREAVRLDPGDREAEEWLSIAETLVRPTAAAEKLPAAAAAVGRPLSRAAPARARSEVSPPAAPGRMGTNADGLAPGAVVPDELPEAVGFGRYLLEVGLVTPLELRAALAYQRSTGIRLGAAASALGFVSALKIEWASLAYHGQFRRGGAAAGLFDDTDVS
jgi:tetratricopeptide (TPR) repeat protein